MLSIAALAKRDGVSKPAVSRKVKQLVAAHGLTVTLDAQGRVAGVNSVQYDHLRNRTDDPSKVQAASPAQAQTAPKPPIAANETYDEALRQRTWVEAERSRLRLAAEKGEYLKSQDVTDGVVMCAEEIVRIIDRLSGPVVDEMAAAVARDGAHGLRVLMKAITFKMKSDVAQALEAVASAPTAARTEPEKSETTVEVDA